MNFEVYQVTYVHSKSSLPEQTWTTHQENPIIMSIQAMVIPLDIITTQMDIKTRYSLEKYGGAVRVHFGKVVLPW